MYHLSLLYIGQLTGLSSYALIRLVAPMMTIWALLGAYLVGREFGGERAGVVTTYLVAGTAFVGFMVARHAQGVTENFSLPYLPAVLLLTARAFSSQV